MLPNATALPDHPRSSRRLLSIAAITCVEFFETGLVMFAAGPIMGGLGLSPGDFALAYTLYGVASIFMLYKHQWMVERLGYRDFILASLLIFAIGGLLCATAGGIEQFVVGRILQGASGATFFTAGRMQINDLPAETRFRGQLCFIGSLLGASAVAPLIAAGLLDLWGWSAIFWCALPLALAVAWLAAPQLSRKTTPAAERSREHWGWLLWLALGIFGLQYTIQQFSAESATAPRSMLAVGLASILALSLFAWRQWQKDRPLIDYRGLAHWRYLLGIGLYFSGYFMAGAIGFLLPIFLQNGLGLPLASTAMTLSLCLSASLLVALIHGVIARRRPRLRFFMLCGLGLYGLACLLLGLTDRSADWHRLLLPVVLCGSAIPLFMGPVAFGTFAQLPARVFSHAYQVKNIVRQLGISSSIALSTVALQFFYGQQLLAQPAAGAPAWSKVLQVIAGNGLGSPLAMACSEVFLLLALGVVPVALLVIGQKTFR